MRSLKELRACFLLTQQHNREATALIQSASDSSLDQAIQEAIKTIPNAYSLSANFAWVALHEGQLIAFRRLDKRGEYEGIRAIYATKQYHNPNARNLLAAVRNSDIHNMVLALLKSNPPAVANFITHRPDEALLAVNPRILSPQTRATLQAEIFNLFEASEWPKVQVKNNASVYSTVQSYLGTEINSPELSRVVPKIEQKNQMKLSANINAGQQVEVPPVPTVPQGSSTTSIVQAVDLVTRKVYPKDTSSGATLPVTTETLDKASSWVMAGPAQLLNTFLSNLPPEAPQGGPENRLPRSDLPDGESGFDVSFLLRWLSREQLQCD